MPRSQAGLGGEVVPGWRAVRELLVAKRRRVKKLLIDRDREKPDEEVLELAREAGVRREFVEEARIAREARIETHQGVVALAGPVPVGVTRRSAHDTAGVPRRGRRRDRSAEPRRDPPDGRDRRRNRRDPPAASQRVACAGGSEGRRGRGRVPADRARRRHPGRARADRAAPACGASDSMRAVRHRSASSRSRTRRSCSCSVPRDVACRGSPVSAAT